VLVPYAGAASRLLCLAQTGDRPDDVATFLIDRAAPGVNVQPVDNLAGLPLSTVQVDVSVGPDDLVGPVRGGWPAVARVLDLATVLRCAEIAGAGRQLLEISVEYAKNRHQFGRPIGQFQAVQYLCTDMAIAAHVTGLFARQAASRLDSARPAVLEVAQAKAYASRAAQRMAHCAHEIHAGFGFMLEADIQLYSRRAKYWEFDLGDGRWHDERLVTALALAADNHAATPRRMRGT
jgi:alkylation response protein AidB-like acyl-CoA dehydrogenase